MFLLKLELCIYLQKTGGTILCVCIFYVKVSVL